MRSFSAGCLAHGLTVSAALAFGTPGLLSAAPEPLEQRLSALVARLGSDALDTREAALDALQRDGSITLPMIEKVLADGTAAGTLSAEQVERLTQAGSKLFARQPRAAMGVSFSWNEKSADGVEISGAIDGFDSKRVLQAGDVIQSLDGIALRDQNQTRAAIVSYSPGDQVTVRVLRQGEPIVVKLQLGDYGELERANRNQRGMLNPNQPGFARSGSLDAQTLREAWSLRRERMTLGPGRTQPDVIEPGLSEHQWSQIDAAAGNREDDRAARIAAAQIRNRQMGGIQVRNNVQVLRVQQAAPTPKDQNGEATVVAGGADRLDVLFAPQAFALSASNDSFGDSSKALRAQWEANNLMLQQQEANLRRPGLPDNVRAALQQNLNRLRAEQTRLKEALNSRLGQVEP